MSEEQFTCMSTRQLLCAIINQVYWFYVMVLAFSAVVPQFKPPIFLHENWEWIKCQREGHHSQRLVPSGENYLVRTLGLSQFLALMMLSVPDGPGLHWTASLPGFSCGPAYLKGGATAQRAGLWAGIRGLACQLLSPRHGTQLGLCCRN